MKRVPLLVWILGPIVVAALVAWPLGGWDTVTVKSRVLPEYSAGKTFHGHRFDIAVGAVALSTSYPGNDDRKPKDGMIYLIARVEVTNVWPEPTGVAPLTGHNLVLEKGKFDDTFGPDVVLHTDDTGLPELNFGMKRPLDLIWTVPDTAVSAGDEVHFTFYDSIPRAGLVVHGTSWVDYFPAAAATRTVH